MQPKVKKKLEASPVKMTKLSKHVINRQLYFSANGETKPSYHTGQ